MTPPDLPDPPYPDCPADPPFGLTGGWTDLGSDVWYRRVGKHDTWVGIIECHRDPAGEWCCGFVCFDVPEADGDLLKRPRWTVETADPLTLSPSVLCSTCSHHGWIKSGRWTA